ncbi:hypothetical protein ACT3CE_09740 [Marinifilum sp. RC60d5]|uniref:hypothetical protein n=1 Tax=Marinifilum sp. RC60d5 TaxID=3458414 RepID=UPI00403557B7
MELKINFVGGRIDNVAGRIHSASSKSAHFQVELAYHRVESTNHASDSMLQASVAFRTWFYANVSGFMPPQVVKLMISYNSIINSSLLPSKPYNKYYLFWVGLLFCRFGR